MRQSESPRLLRSLLARAARPVRRGLLEVRVRVDRALHPSRHRRARDVVLAHRPVRSIVFVCYGNICRSPYAELSLRRALSSATGRDIPTISSVGFLPPGRPSPSDAVEAAGERGIDLGSRRSRVLTPEALRCDLILAMTAEQRRTLRLRYGRPDALHLGDLESDRTHRRDFPDPYGGSLDEFRRIYDRIDGAIGELARLLRESSSPRKREPAAVDDSD